MKQRLHTIERPAIAPIDPVDALITAWNDHQALRRSGASIRELAASRDHLDDVRTHVRRASVAPT